MGGYEYKPIEDWEEVKSFLDRTREYDPDKRWKEAWGCGIYFVDLLYLLVHLVPIACLLGRVLHSTSMFDSRNFSASPAMP